MKDRECNVIALTRSGFTNDLVVVAIINASPDIVMSVCILSAVDPENVQGTPRNIKSKRPPFVYAYM